MTTKTYPRLPEHASPDFARSCRDALPDRGVLVTYDGTETSVLVEPPDLTAAEETALDNAVADFVDLAGAKEDRYQDIDARTVELIEGGFEFPPGSGQLFSLSDRAQRTITGAFSMRDQPEFSYPINWNTIDDAGVFEIAGAETLRLFGLSAAGTVKARKDSGTALKDLVRAAVNVAEVEAVEDLR